MFQHVPNVTKSISHVTNLTKRHISTFIRGKSRYGLRNSISIDIHPELMYRGNSHVISHACEEYDFAPCFIELGSYVVKSLIHWTLP